MHQYACMGMKLSTFPNTPLTFSNAMYAIKHRKGMYILKSGNLCTVYPKQGSLMLIFLANNLPLLDTT